MSADLAQTRHRPRPARPRRVARARHGADRREERRAGPAGGLLPAATDALLAANAKDLAAAKENKLTAAQIDRLTLDAQRIAQMAEGVRQVAALPDPVGEELERTIRPNGLEIRKIRVPIGVIGIIYEARPNVTIDCAVLCLKSGNAAILRGGKEIFSHQHGAGRAGQPGAGRTPACPPTPSSSSPRPIAPRSPRCSSSIRWCTASSRAAARASSASWRSTPPFPSSSISRACASSTSTGTPTPPWRSSIVVNAKAQRPGVCNAAEQLLVHAAAAGTLLPRLARALLAHQVELRCDPAVAAILKKHRLAHRPARTADYSTEFLDLILAVRVVPSLDDAIATINRDSSAHTDTIVTRDAGAARRFLAGVDSAVVLWNASTRFNDGFEFGLGAEIGISTDRLHARGPMGLRELCSYKYVVTGSGQVRK